VDLASVVDSLEGLSARALAEIGEASDPEQLDAVELRYLGRKGELRNLLGGIGQLPAEDRPRVGAAANPIRERLESAFAERRLRLESIALEVRLAGERLDPTLPGRPVPRGSLHPVLETIREVTRVLGQFGFVVFDGPEVETDELNFQALNIPEDHPARDLWDTLYVAPPPDDAGTPAGKRYLLRTHTSPGQIRAMQTFEPPIRVLLPGRCFRYEQVNAGSSFEFFQIEGLMIDEGTTMGDLRGLLDEVAHALFGAGRPTRYRPGYYPFTEPSVAFDVRCVVCEGKGCPVCKRSGWMTILGAGMVHPAVLRNGGLDPERYQGFAFGMGPDRMTIQRYGVEDIRLFLENDVRFLERYAVTR
jgi:phenylalanyl-tRNA synthetase alpha chain